MSTTRARRTGPEHFLAAESLIQQSAEADPEHAAHLVGRAQAHATLALVAATAVEFTAEHDAVIVNSPWSALFSPTPTTESE